MVVQVDRRSWDAEQLAAWRLLGAAQQRCSAALAAQHRRIEQLEAELLRTRAALVARTTALAWAQRQGVAAIDKDDPLALDESLQAADLVICQTGCLSHGEYWRVRDHCRRTGKTCVMVEQPEALRIVRLQRESVA
ncbi:DUF2325 domain-containing protein [Pseudorhodoferax sp.]|uniref:DUF2325 domain-containing protein n=1 Tax=Pseudorhodoferax sp. TaxID=1993553 RepID=UPI002DD63B77|nr:DUF2325 domain-containing protein [Pseudorhodoferax sp.]